MTSMLEYRGVSKTYPGGERAAARDVDLAVDRGEMVAFVGESGCGKTTLLRLVAGLEMPDAGAIRIDGKTVADARTWVPPEKRGVGLVFQGGALFPHLNVARNVAYGLHARPRVERMTLVREMLALVGLPKTEKRYPHELSGGERQRLALARALAPKPNLILLDEPFSNLDRCLRCALRDEVRRILKEVGITSVLVTHDADDAFVVGDRIAAFREGRLEQVGTSAELCQAPASDYCARLFCIGPRLGDQAAPARAAARAGEAQAPAE